METITLDVKNTHHIQVMGLVQVAAIYGYSGLGQLMPAKLEYFREKLSLIERYPQTWINSLDLNNYENLYHYLNSLNQ